MHAVLHLIAPGRKKKAASGAELTHHSQLKISQVIIYTRYDCDPAPGRKKLTAILIGNIRGQSEFRIGLYQKIFGPLRVTTQVVLICLLRAIDSLESLHDIRLRRREIPVPVRIDIYHRSLCEHYPDTR